VLIIDVHLNEGENLIKVARWSIVNCIDTVWFIFHNLPFVTAT